MDGSAVNSSPSASGYYWKDCDPYDDQSGGASAGLLILFTACLCEFLLGTPSNLWLVHHIIGKMSKDCGVLPADIFPLHMALFQLFFYLVLPLLFTNHFLWQNKFLFAVMAGLFYLELAMKLLLYCLVSVERYMAAVRPLDYIRYKARQYRWGSLGVLWCLAILVTSAAVTGYSSIAVCIVFLPVQAVDTFCSISVLRTLRKPPPGDRATAEEDKEGEGKRKADTNCSEEEDKGKAVGRREPRGRGEMNSMKRKALITIVIIQAVLTLNYLPFIICMLIKGLVPARALKCQYQTMALAAAASCSYLQPLLYLYRLGRLPLTTTHNT